MIQHVYERSLKVIPELLVATDDVRIMETVQSFGGNAVMTSLIIVLELTDAMKHIVFGHQNRKKIMNI